MRGVCANLNTNRNQCHELLSVAPDRTANIDATFVPLDIPPTWDVGAFIIFVHYSVHSSFNMRPNLFDPLRRELVF